MESTLLCEPLDLPISGPVQELPANVNPEHLALSNIDPYSTLPADPSLLFAAPPTIADVEEEVLLKQEPPETTTYNGDGGEGQEDFDALSAFLHTTPPTGTTPPHTFASPLSFPATTTITTTNNSTTSLSPSTPSPSTPSSTAAIPLASTTPTSILTAKPSSSPSNTNSSYTTASATTTIPILDDLDSFLIPNTPLPPPSPSPPHTATPRYLPPISYSTSLAEIPTLTPPHKVPIPSSTTTKIIQPIPRVSSPSAKSPPSRLPGGTSTRFTPGTVPRGNTHASRKLGYVTKYRELPISRKSSIVDHTLTRAKQPRLCFFCRYVRKIAEAARKAGQATTVVPSGPGEGTDHMDGGHEGGALGGGGVGKGGGCGEKIAGNGGGGQGRKGGVGEKEIEVVKQARKHPQGPREGHVRRTSFECGGCRYPLCKEFCFKAFHDA